MSHPVPASALVAAAAAAKAAGVGDFFSYLWDYQTATKDPLVSYLRVFHEDALAGYVKARGASKILDSLIPEAAHKVGYSASTVAGARASAERLTFYLAERLFPIDGRTFPQAGYALKFVNEQGPRFVSLAEAAAKAVPRHRIERAGTVPASTSSVKLSAPSATKSSYGWLVAVAAGVGALLVVRAVVR